MRKSAASVAFACICQAAVAHAAITGREAVFTAQCTDQAATAFQWKNGQWVLVPYFPNIYRVDKRPASSPGCAEILAAKSALSATFDDVTYGCYRITPLRPGHHPADRLRRAVERPRHRRDLAERHLRRRGAVPLDRFRSGRNLPVRAARGGPQHCSPRRHEGPADPVGRPLHDRPPAASPGLDSAAVELAAVGVDLAARGKFPLQAPRAASGAASSTARSASE